MCLRLAHHIVIIVRFTSRPNKVGRAHQRRGAGAYLGDFGDRVREGGCVEEHLLVEAVGVND